MSELIEKDDDSTHKSNIWMDITSKSLRKPTIIHNSTELSQNDTFIEVDQS